MGYAIVHEKFINGDGENMHIFKDAVLKKQNDDSNKYTVTIENLSQCSEATKKRTFKDLISYNKKCANNTSNINCFLKDKKYYANSNQNETVYYCENEKIAMFVCAYIGKHVCGTCVATLYADN